MVKGEGKKKGDIEINNDAVPFWKRAIAFLLDILVINLIVVWPFEGVFTTNFKGTFTETLMASNAQLPLQVYFAVFIISILALLYFAFFEYYLGQTIGKMLFNIKIIDNNDNLGFWKCLASNLFILPFFPFYVFWFIEPVYLIFYKQRFLERLTNTRTVNIVKKRYFEEYDLKKV